MAASKERLPAGADKRRLILDAGVRVFASRGFHGCRVADVADEAGVAYGLVYHYFRSKDALLDTIFLERWEVLLTVIEEARQRAGVSGRDRLGEVAAFIVESYRHDPDLMKVVIVEVTRAANTFGRTHLEQISAAYDGIAGIVRDAQERGEFRGEVDADLAALAFYGVVEQVLTGWIFGLLPTGDEEFGSARARIVDTVCGGLDAST